MFMTSVCNIIVRIVKFIKLYLLYHLHEIKYFLSPFFFYFSNVIQHNRYITLNLKIIIALAKIVILTGFFYFGLCKALLQVVVTFTCSNVFFS